MLQDRIELLMLLRSLVLSDRADFVGLCDIVLSERGRELEELHDIAGQGACFVGEYVLYLAKLLVDAGRLVAHE